MRHDINQLMDMQCRDDWMNIIFLTHLIDQRNRHFTFKMGTTCYHACNMCAMIMEIFVYDTTPFPQWLLHVNVCGSLWKLTIGHIDNIHCSAPMHLYHINLDHFPLHLNMWVLFSQTRWSKSEIWLKTSEVVNMASIASLSVNQADTLVQICTWAGPKYSANSSICLAPNHKVRYLFECDGNDF